MSGLLDRPRVGLGVLIFKDGKILIGKRLSAHGEGVWAPPGGHLENGESLEECAKREVLEETNLEIGNIKIGPLTNDIFKETKKHYITCFMLSNEIKGLLKVLEPEKCESWQWFDLNNLPSPLFLPLQNLLKETSLKKLYSSFFPRQKIAYLACPYAHNDLSVMELRLKIVTQVASRLHLKNLYVFSPLTHNIPLMEHGPKQSWERWKSFDLSMLVKSDALYVLKLNGWEQSQGVQEEMAIAKTYDIPIIEINYNNETNELSFSKNLI